MFFSGLLLWVIVTTDIFASPTLAHQAPLSKWTLQARISGLFFSVEACHIVQTFQNVQDSWSARSDPRWASQIDTLFHFLQFFSFPTPVSNFLIPYTWYFLIYFLKFVLLIFSWMVAIAISFNNSDWIFLYNSINFYIFY